MNIPASNIMPANTIDHGIKKSNPNTGRLAAMLNLVENSLVTVSTYSQLITSVTASAAKVCDALGLNKLVKGLTWVGNTMGQVAQLGKNAADVAQLFDKGAKIAEYGISTLLYEVMILLKGQALPIMDCWINKVIDAGEKVTMGEALESLMECIINNKEINLLFKGITTA